MTSFIRKCTHFFVEKASQVSHKWLSRSLTFCFDFLKDKDFSKDWKFSNELSFAVLTRKGVYLIQKNIYVLFHKITCFFEECSVLCTEGGFSLSSLFKPTPVLPESKNLSRFIDALTQNYLDHLIFLFFLRQKLVKIIFGSTNQMKNNVTFSEKIWNPATYFMDGP